MGMFPHSHMWLFDVPFLKPNSYCCSRSVQCCNSKCVTGLLSKTLWLNVRQLPHTDPLLSFLNLRPMWTHKGSKYQLSRNHAESPWSMICAYQTEEIILSNMKPGHCGNNVQSIYAPWLCPFYTEPYCCSDNHLLTGQPDMRSYGTCLLSSRSLGLKSAVVRPLEIWFMVKRDLDICIGKTRSEVCVSVRRREPC